MTSTPFINKFQSEKRSIKEDKLLSVNSHLNITGTQAEYSSVVNET